MRTSIRRVQTKWRLELLESKLNWTHFTLLTEASGGRTFSIFQSHYQWFGKKSLQKSFFRAIHRPATDLRTNTPFAPALLDLRRIPPILTPHPELHRILRRL